MESENSLQGAVATQVTKSVAVTVSHVADAATRTGHLLVGASLQSERDREAGDNLVALARSEAIATEHLAYIVVYDKTGTYIDAIVRTPKGGATPDVSREKLADALAESATRAGGVWTVERPRDGKDELSYTVPLVAPGGQHTGFVRAFVSRGALSELVGTVSSERLGSPNAVFLLDE